MTIHEPISLLAPGPKLTNILVPKNRRPKFDLHLKIIDLNNVPYVSGKSFIKWHLQHSAATEHRGRTDRVGIKEHKVIYDYETTLPVRLVIDKTAVLQELIMIFEVMHEVFVHGKGERSALGTVKINLAEYVEASEQDGDEGVVRRYLMQDSKINSTLKLSVFMRQTDGDRNFIPPPLRVAPVFTGIAGIMTQEPVDSEDSGSTQHAVTSKSREAGDELRELYRRTLAAEWTCQAGELSADKAIEDIFHGGDGWGHALNGGQMTSPSKKHHSIQAEGLGSLTDNDARRYQTAKENGSWQSFFRRPSRQDIKRTSRESPSKRSDMGSGGVRGRGSFEQQVHQMKGEVENGHRIQHEVDEFDLREDLRSWNISKCL
ncbi:hypothetical protein EJ08DRAFT_686505 [Tothia fuscella]|uniref:C2 NT-type domain-containing protein n=1 Tax=Tothia fuscella TaxID=1048955 RepID=A0A9P4NXN3_9PEZI|nr:hypothetical protein EJ08DRAFT_686505 [Tothia fuscella]